MSISRRIELVAAVAATLALPACSIPTEGWNIALTELKGFEPLEEYRGWWESVEACSSRSGDFDLVRWYEAEEIVIEGETLLGFWEAPHDITLLGTAKEVSLIVRHEMLHDLLRGDPDHQQEEWTRCNLGRQDSV